MFIIWLISLIIWSYLETKYRATPGWHYFHSLPFFLTQATFHIPNAWESPNLWTVPTSFPNSPSDLLQQSNTSKQLLWQAAIGPMGLPSLPSPLPSVSSANQHSRYVLDTNEDPHTHAYVCLLKDDKRTISQAICRAPNWDHQEPQFHWDLRVSNTHCFERVRCRTSSLQSPACGDRSLPLPPSHIENCTQEFLMENTEKFA